MKGPLYWMRKFTICPRCGGMMNKARPLIGETSEFWFRCTRCRTFVNSYIPQRHQRAVHEDNHTYIGNFGGFGTGKTTTTREEIYKHIFLTPNAIVLVSANVQSQYENTIKREIEKDIPIEFIKYVSNQKQFIDFVNGARIMFRPLDDPEKLRSLNVTMFVIVEASETDENSFHQLKTRLRNLNAAEVKRDITGTPILKLIDGQYVPQIEYTWMKGIVESNPGAGWIRSSLLYVSDEIQKHGNAIADIKVPDDVKDPAISSHVASTDVNAFLPPGFIDNICKNKPGWWVARFVLSSFEYAEGLVYPSAGLHVIPTFEIPNDWIHLVAADYGLSDDFVYLFGAVDKHNGIVYIYKEIRVNNKNIEDLARLFKEGTAHIPLGAWYTQPIMDPKSLGKRDYEKKTLGEHFVDYGIHFKPGHIQVDARVFRVNTYLESGRLKIMDCCTALINELRDYKFPERKLDTTDKAANKPVDKNNHGINPLEWICMELPSDPKHLIFGAYNKYGMRTDEIVYIEENDWMPFALRDEPQQKSRVGDW